MTSDRCDWAALRVGSASDSRNRGSYDSRCTSTHAPGGNFGPGTEFRETSALSTVSECRFQIVVT
ncbi:hypothetical protein Taro_038154 [Colocasia esculenta]|uniref:Uncharacterized protein n=1 Tax=Colocasia esculenta TaxID=4460 RepID=A0A843WMV2_COLES|nr:hypothetical protein [Colocasia esculenta]